MITCPKCNASLPDWSTACQFCKADTTKVSRPVEIAKPKYRRQQANWIWPAYYIISVYWIISGLEGILQALHVGPFAATIVVEGIKIEPGVDLIGLVSGGFSAVVGLGLLFKLEFLRGVANVLCFLQILGGVLGLWGGVLSSALFGGIGVLITIMGILDIASAALMIYVLGETD